MPAHGETGNRLTRTIASPRWGWLVTLIGLLFAAAMVGGVGEPDNETDSRYLLPDDADSTAAAWLVDRLPDETTEAAIVLWTVEDGKLDGRQLGALKEQAGQGPLIPAEDGTAAFTVLSVTAGSADVVGEQVEDLRSQLRDDAPDGVTVQVTGPAGIHADLGKVFDGADLRLLLATMLIVAILLVVTYRSPVLWIIPLLVVGLADRLAVVAATSVLAAFDMSWDGTTTGILSVLVFGAGTNYALLLISRYRDELRVHESRYAAMAHALARTAEAVMASALTVLVAVLTLLLSLTPSTRGLGLACAMGILIAASYVLIVLPAALVLFGRWVFWPMVPRHGDRRAAETSSLFHRVGQVVARRPVLILSGTLLLLAVLAIGNTGLRLGLDEADQLLDRPEAVTAAERLSESFPSGTVEPTQVLTEGDAKATLTTIEKTAGVESARQTAAGNGITQFEVVLASEPGSGEAKDTVERLRDNLEDTQALVGGNEAEAIDARTAAARDMGIIGPLILLLVLCGLILLLRSILGPILLALSVVATYTAAFGASWWIFQGIFDFPAVALNVPMFAFLFLVALGVDYNIFLVTRAREEAREHGARLGMLRALTVTGGVITSAGILLAAVFAVLGVLPLVALAQMGTIICIGVLLDTLVVRTMLVPALAMILGDRFWWPGGPAGFTPRRG